MLFNTYRTDGYEVLNNCKRAYFAHQEPGVHLFEGEGKNWRELLELLLANRPEMFCAQEEVERIKEIHRIYDKAEDIGIIWKDEVNDKIIVRCLDESEMSAIKSFVTALCCKMVLWRERGFPARQLNYDELGREDFLVTHRREYEIITLFEAFKAYQELDQELLNQINRMTEDKFSEMYGG